ncbi:outer membrane receptor protein involved in Fe transport [Eilatimonas milleporae]|uniref:Outer membrane receptor protein involved in Fe transport n=2 Tax=Eilatimonas milleporae TaxID=911205 RepID=A0A3M0C526_9PROT|nr:outer membrane receptor protein involved in Fe transport [Eilatimonas milleporae]
MKSFLLMTTALAPLIGISTGAALAQSSAPAGSEEFMMEEITVSARRRLETLQDVPIAVDVLTAEQIRARGINTTEDVAKFTSGLVFDQGISLQDTRPVIRGLPATRGRPPVGVLLDGIDVSSESLGNAGGGSLLNQRLLDLERIEVVKGPQSALYGRAAFAGAVNYVTKRPGDEFEGEVNASYGRFGTFDIGGAISGPISDTLGFRLNAVHAEFDGDYDNPVTGADLNGFSNTGGSAALELDNKGVNIFARVSYSEYEADQRAIQNVSGFTGGVSRPGPDTPEGQAVAAAVAGGVLEFPLASNVPPAGDLSFTGVTGYSIDPRTGRDFPGSDGSIFSVTVNVSVDLEGAELVYNGGYVKQDERLVYDGDFFGLPLASFPDGEVEPLNIFDVVDFDNTVEINSQEVRLQNFGEDAFRWAVGALYWSSDMDQTNRSLRAFSGFPFTGSPDIANFSPTSIFLNSVIPESPFGRDIESVSVYGLVEYDLTERLTVSAESRYVDESTTVIRSDFLQAAFAPIPAGFVNGVQEESIDDAEFLPKLTVSYAAGDNLNLYASVAKGFKPAGVSELDFGSQLADSRFDAEKVWNYEFGLKGSTADRQLAYSAAIFYMDWTDRQVSQLLEDPDAPAGFRATVQNASGAEVLGFEASFIYRPSAVPGLTIDAAYTYLDTEFTDFTILSNSGFVVTEAANCTVVTVGDSNVCEVTYNGNRLERAPKHQLVSNLSYVTEVSQGIDLVLGVNLQYQGSRFLTQANRITLPSFVNMDAQVGLQFEDVLVQAYVQNLTNQDAVRTAQNNFDLASFGRAVNVYAPPRRVFGLRGGIRF